jgi:hypothetical protein
VDPQYFTDYYRTLSAGSMNVTMSANSLNVTAMVRSTGEVMARFRIRRKTPCSGAS